MESIHAWPNYTAATAVFLACGPCNGMKVMFSDMTVCCRSQETSSSLWPIILNPFLLFWQKIKNNNNNTRRHYRQMYLFTRLFFSITDEMFQCLQILQDILVWKIIMKVTNKHTLMTFFGFISFSCINACVLFIIKSCVPTGIKEYMSYIDPILAHTNQTPCSHYKVQVRCVLGTHKSTCAWIW